MYDKENKRGNVPLRTSLDALIFHDGHLIGVRPIREGTIKAKDIFSNAERNRLDQIKWLREHGRA